MVMLGCPGETRGSSGAGRALARFVRDDPLISGSGALSKSGVGHSGDPVLEWVKDKG